MTARYADDPVHRLNNLLCKIVGSAELALDRVDDAAARSELNAIIELAEAGARLVNTLVGQAPGSR